TLPHTSGGARREVVERKLSQLYRGITYRAAHFINREQDKRKDDRFLFVALNSSDSIQGWIGIIEEQQAPLVGVYLLPMVSQSLVRRMKLMAPHILLCERLSSGLRQSYLHNGRLRISRLTPVPPVAQSQLGHFYVSETEKTRLYLISQRFIGSDTPLSMVLPSLDESNKSICHDVEQGVGIECSSLDLAKFAQSLRLDPQLLQNNPELLHMQLLAMGSVPDNLAPSGLIKHHQLNFIRQLINGVTAAIVLGGLVLAGIYLKQSLDDSAFTEQAKIATSEQERLYGDVAKNFPTTAIPSNDLKLAVELQQVIAHQTKPPKRMMQTLSKAIEPTPEIQINRLHWVLTNEADPKDDDKTHSVAPEPKQAAAATTQPNFVPDPKLLYEVGFVNGEIKNFTGDYRKALESVNHLSERLKADSAVAQVIILQGPVNVSSYTSLQGSTADERTAQLPAALFKLRVTLKQEVVPPV
ncbi:MAG TPA: hypothetical protein VJB68_00840, partial [Methylophilaceae bacterium]|nr:hypothetical protein [Methylophilaceae bacterium]